MPKKLSFEKAKAMYVHRFTMEHVPAWARYPRIDGTFYAPQYITDQEWYDNTVFPPDERCYKTDCYSRNPSWPLGKSLPGTYRRVYAS